MWFLEILVELGLLIADLDHYKKVGKKEKEDGISRPIQKYALSPSGIVFVLFLVIGTTLGTGWFLYRTIFLYPKQTLKEMQEIDAFAQEWERNTNKKVISLEDLISGRPLKKDWLKDAWGTPYKVSTIQGFQLISAGKDYTFGTKDDIKIFHE